MLPRIGITMGDPAGIGSEITARMLASGEIASLCIPIVVSDARVTRQGFEIIGVEPNFEIVHDLGGKLGVVVGAPGMAHDRGAVRDQ